MDRLILATLTVISLTYSQTLPLGVQKKAALEGMTKAQATYSRWAADMRHEQALPEMAERLHTPQ